MLELYNNAMSTCSQKVRLCLSEKALDWTDHQSIFVRAISSSLNIWRSIPMASYRRW